MTVRAMEIEKNIPIPPTKSRRRRYPELPEVGDSFLVELGDGEDLNYLQRLVCATMGARGRRLGHVYTTRQEERGVRIWRVE